MSSVCALDWLWTSYYLPERHPFFFRLDPLEEAAGAQAIIDRGRNGLSHYKP